MEPSTPGHFHTQTQTFTGQCSWKPKKWPGKAKKPKNSPQWLNGQPFDYKSERVLADFCRLNHPLVRESLVVKNKYNIGLYKYNFGLPSAPKTFRCSSDPKPHHKYVCVSDNSTTEHARNAVRENTWQITKKHEKKIQHFCFLSNSKTHFVLGHWKLKNENTYIWAIKQCNFFLL